MSETRGALRREMRDRRRALPAPRRIVAAEALANHLLALPFAPRTGFVAGYWATDGEIPLHAWQLRLPREVRYCLPVLHGDGTLRFAPWAPGAPLAPNRYGIPEPEVAAGDLLEPAQLDLVVVPLVAFDARCHRLGMGGGWYDRSFAFRAARPAPPHLVGAGFSFQQSGPIAAEAWDVALDAVCTESDTFFPVA
ncbi:5-formyltetrahydrofolate cyclo-ligase [Luteimonas sp. J16]|jgi:5-formyltetrahydrofolate cyclo-ligase|uniref:5-formyltetrahydrofolate cyclo-ligase n=1 Tax=unclassified Luteimonas TaxID=2629088 RepID=UPI00047A9282|nr:MULTISPECIES: 5-formyltetrahydrofolate cyclo-ligase [unclassified Luteimonas]TWG91620.1 5-formyltetrahydrofolate cyclo-ligase [Luteimonas sp. J16]